MEITPEQYERIQDCLPVHRGNVRDRAYEGDETRQLVMELNMIPVVPPKSNRKDPWDYDRALYKNGMKWNVCFADGKASGAFFLVSKNLISYF